MIRWHLKELMADRRMTPAQLIAETGLTFSAAYKLIRRRPENPPRLEIATLDALCEALNCEPGDLLTRRRR